MKQFFRRSLALLFVFVLVLSMFSGCSGKKPLRVAIKEITKHGNIILDTDFDTVESHNMEPGDLITVTIGSEKIDMPIGTLYSDVDTGSYVCRFDKEDNQVVLAINMGDFATFSKTGVKEEIAEEPGYKWNSSVSEVTLVLKEKYGYLDEYNARNLTRTNNREDYSELSDEQFANFRAVSCTGIRENLLYRSSSPIDPSLGRNTYTMTAMEKAGICSVMNLVDTAEAMAGYETFAGSYYSKCNILECPLTYDFTSAEFSSGVLDCVEFIIHMDGPYLIHCKEGKDRTGILCALLECYMGATFDEIKKDYMLTYENYYHITPEDKAYSITLNNNLIKTLCKLFQADDLSKIDLSGAAETYFLSIGLTEEELVQLALKLG